MSATGKATVTHTADAGPARRAPLMLATEGWADYALLDHGDGEKLERYGRYVIVRPEEQAMGSRRRPSAEWDTADAHFVGISDDEAAGRWRFRKPLPDTWPMEFGGVVQGLPDAPGSQRKNKGLN